MKTPLAWLAAGLLAGMSLHAGAQTLGVTLEATLLDFGPNLPVKGVIDKDYGLDGPNGEWRFDKFDAFCVDPFQILVFNEAVVYTIQDPATLAEVGAVQRILGGYYATPMSNLDAAGAQWAIWEAIFDGTSNPTFAAGSVRLNEPTSAVAQRALDYLTNLATLPEVEVLYLTSPTRQDMITVVPEPAAGVLAAGGLLLVGLRRRR